MEKRKPNPLSLIKKGERLEESCYNEKGNLVEIVSSHQFRTMFFLYQVKDGKAERVGKGKNPIEARADAKKQKKKG